MNNILSVYTFKYPLLYIGCCGEWRITVIYHCQFRRFMSVWVVATHFHNTIIESCQKTSPIAMLIECRKLLCAIIDDNLPVESIAIAGVPIICWRL